MTAPVLQPDDSLRDAAALTFAVMRFAEGAAHPPRVQPEGLPRLGEETWIFVPSNRRVSFEDVPAFLAGLPSPALLCPTTTRGIVALHLLSELSGERASGARKNFANQRAGLQEMADQLGLTPESRIVFESGDETHVVSLAVLTLFIERFLVDIGWSIVDLVNDTRASARLMLHRSDGVNSRRS
jgi:hypothetical protein